LREGKGNEGLFLTFFPLQNLTLKLGGNGLEGKKILYFFNINLLF